MKMTVIPIVIGAERTITVGLVKGLEDLEIKGNHPNNTIIEIESWRLEETYCHSNFSETTSTNANDTIKQVEMKEKMIPEEP